MSNVYSKLQKARKMLQETSLNKSGKNKFSNYDYFELGDFLPRVNEIFDELGLCSCTTFTSDYATMNIYNSEKPEEVISFGTHLAGAELKGCSPIQQVGSQHTYARRYLYLIALEIVENDILEENTGKNNTDKPKKQSNGVISDSQVKRLYSLGKGKDVAVIKGILNEFGFASATDVLKDKYKEICELIEAL